MDLMISIGLLLVAAVLGAWRLESEFDRESRLEPGKQPGDAVE